MRTAKFETEPFTCPSCVKKIETIIGKMNGVTATKVLFNSSKFKVDFNESVVSSDEIANSIEGLGYPILSQKVS